jgi:membrane-bound lytic murein transglycosylase B
MLFRICLCAVLMVVATGIRADLSAWPDATDVEQFINDMRARHAYSSEDLRRMFAASRPNEQVLQAIAPPKDPEARSWQRYRTRFVNPARIEKGVEFWKRHRDTLARAEAQYGVPAPIVVAIIGVETEYGRNTGKFEVFEALATLAFTKLPRAPYFRSELEEFLVLSRENRLDPRRVTGSYAGAIGIPQFMPGSQRRFAVDFDNDGQIDLARSYPDAIGSVARFLQAHGWVSGNPVVERLPENFEARDDWLRAGIKPALEKTHLEAAGFDLVNGPKHFPVALVDLESPGQKTEYWWGHGNFYAITRYNRSSSYAMSVVQLADEIARRNASTGGTPIRAGSRASRHRAG